MARAHDEDPDLKLVEELIFAGTGLTLERFERAETLAGRTPDFRVRRGRVLVAYCEVKSPRDDWLDEQLDEAAAFEIVGGARSDPTFNRIARHVAKAATQFDAVNADRLVPNILIFVNHAHASGFADLRETLTGTFFAESGEQYKTLIHIAEGRIGEARSKIDLYGWIDGKTRRAQGYLFNDANPKQVETVCALLGIDKNAIDFPSR
jgi:hypothetical protein